MFHTHKRKTASRSFQNREARWKQAGGATFLVHYAGRKIHIREDQQEKYMIVYGGPTPPKLPCFTLFIENEDNGQKSAELHGIVRDNGCFLDELSNSRDLVGVAVKFARKRFNVTLLRLVDNSKIVCPETIFLSNLSLVTTGFTWYQSCIPGLMPEDPDERELFTQWQTCVNTVSWDTLYDYLDKHGVAPPPDGFDTAHLDTARPGSAKTVLNRLKQSKRGCSFFSAHLTQINDGFGIKISLTSPKNTPKNPLYGWSWIVHFTNPLSAATTRRQQRTTNRGKTRRAKSSAPV